MARRHPAVTSTRPCFNPFAKLRCPDRLELHTVVRSCGGKAWASTPCVYFLCLIQGRKGWYSAIGSRRLDVVSPLFLLAKLIAPTRGRTQAENIGKTAIPDDGDAQSGARNHNTLNGDVAYLAGRFPEADEDALIRAVQILRGVVSYHL